ncbi:MAG: FAD-dependent oxidoreductase [Chloroflexi bacterium]|nr:FAD-dependent oxidoreductase [Chloroflexota bacterium]
MVEEATLNKLLEPGRIGSMALKNRIVMPPMATGYCSSDGAVTPKMKDYYEVRAKGGPGLVIVEWTCVESRVGRLGLGPGGKGALCIDEDRLIPGLSELVQAIKRGGAKAGIQLAHAGGAARSTVTGSQPIAPSPIPASPKEFSTEIPREMTKAEIRGLVVKFADAAERAIEAGFDGVEIHAAHNYLLAQFLSPLTNQRTDEYGGSVRNRVRFILEIIKSVRERVGKDYPVWCRVNGGGGGLAAGITPEDLAEQARLLEASGIQAISVSGLPGIRSYFYPPGYYLKMAEIVKKAVKVPVVATGRVTPELGEQTLREGKADFIAFGRPFITDPQWLEKLTSRRKGEVVPCIGCLQCHHSIIVEVEGLRCSVNATVGRERETELKPVSKPRRVLVVGGGPAGMEAAIVAATRGHEVILFDENDQLGGQMVLAAKPPHKESIADFTSCLANQLARAKVAIRTRTRVTAEMVQQVHPEIVILATGVVPFIPPIPGVDGPSVVTAQDILSGRKKPGPTVVIIGGELVACETALFLVGKSRKVILVRRGQEFASKVTPRVREPMMGHLSASRVVMLSSMRYERITDRGIVLKSGHTGTKTLEASTIVLAAGARPNLELLNALQFKGYEIRSVGDCVLPRNILSAVAEGIEVGRTV